jgi:hypothetical protein
MQIYGSPFLVRLTIWDAANLEVLHVFTTVETIDKIEFR